MGTQQQKSRWENNGARTTTYRAQRVLEVALLIANVAPVLAAASLDNVVLVGVEKVDRGASVYRQQQ